MDCLTNFLSCYLLFGVGLFFTTLILFIIIMTAGKHEDKIPNYVIYGIFYPIAGLGWFCDILFDTLFGNVMFGFKGSGYKEFWDTKDLNKITFTQRLKRILRKQTDITPDMYRYKMAYWLCVLLEKFDKDHCDLCDL